MLPLEIESRLDTIRSLVEREGTELIDIQVRRSHGNRAVLTVTVDKPGGVTLDDCAQVNRRLSVFLDDQAENGEAGLLAGSYYLEVNSPGLDRPLKTPKDFERAKGGWARIAWKTEAGAGLVTIGRLQDVGAEGVELEDKKGQKVRILYAAMTKAARDVGI